MNSGASFLTMGDIDDAIRRAKRNQVDFLKIEVQASLAFLGRALSTLDPETRERNRRNARTGYDTILRMLERADLDEEDAEELVAGLHRLQTELKELGEEF